MAVPYSAASERSEAAGSVSREVAASSNWVVYATLLASVSIVVGLVWDISWHRTVGRDTFWTAPHVLEQAAAVVAGLSCGFLALRTTFAGSAADRAMSVRFWRLFQAPLGAWVCIWGTLMMITSAPFDNWWHNAYGLDVRIISPPHMILALGMLGIEIGALMMALGAQNRAKSDDDKRRFGLVYAAGASVVIVMAGVLMTEYASFANDMHGAVFYQVSGVAVPLFLVALARASRLEWPATRIAIGYVLFMLVAIWILELVPAQPRLAPIYNPVTRMVPPPFPLLLFVPAIAIDMALSRLGRLNDWFLSGVVGVSFVVLMAAAHWFWADFLLSPGARNFFFAADHWDYTNSLGPWRYKFWNLDVDQSGNWSAAAFASGLAVAMGLAIVSSRIGLAWGRGLSRVKR